MGSIGGLNRSKMGKHNYKDPNDIGNSEKYHTGKSCIEDNCNRPAGTMWGKLWCYECNVKRIDRISKQLSSIVHDIGVK